MNWIHRLNIASRVALGFGLLLLMAAVLATLALLALQRSGGAVDRIVHGEWVKASAAAAIDATTRANARRTMELFFADGAGATQVREHIAANRRTIDEALATLDRLVVLPEGQALLARVKQARAGYVASFSEVDRQLQAGQRETAQATLLRSTLPALDALQAQVQALSRFQARLATDTGAQVMADIDGTVAWLGALGAAMLAVAVLMGWWLARAIARPIEQAVAVAERVAAGALGHRIETRQGGEPGRLMQALARMDHSLVQVVGRVRAASDSIATGSTQIATGTSDLSQRTEEQAANLQQTAASMEQLAGTVRNSADAARAASRLASQTRDDAVRGGALMQTVNDTMQRISDASRRIGEINTVIDGIAFQTNILALNAAVEAARAGEHGRGFAVVAAEVRALAQRSAEAARSIKNLVADSMGSVDEGQASVAQAVRQIDGIVAQVRSVSETVAQISGAADEQTRGIEQVNQAVAQLDQVTQQNAALVEESAAASGSLRHQAAQMVEAVGAFRIGTA
ncbi:methyl-accepting chemotaxis protein [Rubrivivax sp. RP6-9]|uniref:methyl-accepting chemotaxis protein n=1 Tax=Rubrivivax sp. RP6-9 TaxID=3415750 RepID=UPI003CC5B6D6